MDQQISPDSQIDLINQIRSLQQQLARFDYGIIDKPSLEEYPFCCPDNSKSREGLTMRGKIRSLQSKCPNCKGKFIETADNIGCPSCLIPAKTFYVDIFWRGQRIKIYRDKSGYVLDSYRRAQRLIEKIRSEIDEKSFDPKFYLKTHYEKYLFENFVKQWFDQTKGNLTAASQYKRQITIKNHYLSFFHGRDIREIRGFDINEFQHSLTEKVGLAYQRYIMGDLHKLFADAFTWEMIEKVPIFPKMRNESHPVDWIDSDTQQKILQAIEPDHRPIFEFLILTGCRIGEGRALKWDCVDFKNRALIIRRTWSLNELRECTKTNGWRILPMSDEIYNLLNSIPRSLGFVFLNPITGNSYSHFISSVWKRACKKIGVTIKLYNGTRHSFLTQRAHMGHSLNNLQAVAGHTKVSTTQKYIDMVKADLLPVIEGKRVIKLDRPQETVRGLSVDKNKGK